MLSFQKPVSMTFRCQDNCDKLVNKVNQTRDALSIFGD